MLLDFTIAFPGFYEAVNRLSFEKGTVFVFRIDQNEFSLIGEKQQQRLYNRVACDGRTSFTYITVKTQDMVDFTYYRTLEFEFDMESLVREVNSKVPVIQSAGYEIQGIRLYMDSDQHLKFELKERL